MPIIPVYIVIPIVKFNNRPIIAIIAKLVANEIPKVCKLDSCFNSFG